MPIITKVTKQQKNTERYNIFTDEGQGEKYAFSVDEAVLIKFNLKKGLELNELALTELHYEDDIRKAYNTALHYLARRIRSEHEVKCYLREKEVEEPIIREVIFKLYEYSFLDDKQYALAFVRTQMNTSDKGTELVKRELKEKGISSEIIQRVIKEYPYEIELEKAKSLCEKMVSKNKRDSEKMLNQKLEQLLARKGFPYAIISEAIISVDSSDEEDSLAALRYQAEKAHRKYSSLSGYEYKQKMKQFLFRKGFDLQDIEKYLEEQADE